MEQPPTCNMKSLTLTHCVGLAAVALFAGLNCGQAQTARPNPTTVRTNALLILSSMPDKMPGADKDTPALVALGKEALLREALSKNGTQSCNSCHAVDGGRAGVDNEPTSPGAFGKRGDRNSPTTLNAACTWRNSGTDVRPISRSRPRGRFSIPLRWPCPPSRRCSSD